MKVLIAEDNDNDRRLLSLNLKYYGWQVLEASNGYEAFEIAEKDKPDLIISDILMPKMDGFELLWNLKQRDETKSIPFIFYSAVYTGEKDKRLAKALGAEAFLEKPQEPEELFNKIVSIVEDCKLKKSANLPNMEILMKELDFLKAYSQIVASKLDEKVRDLIELNERYSKLYNEYKTFLNSIPDNIYLIDLDFKILWVNKRIETLFDVKTEEIIGKRCFEVFYNSDQPCIICAAQRVTISKMIEYDEKKDKDGKIWDIRAVPILNRDNEIINIIVIARDITEERITLEQLIHAQRMEDIGILAGGIAHDFRNMLTPVLGFAQLIKLAVAEHSPIYTYAENIIAAAEKASQLAQGLLAFSRKQILDMKPILIDNLILNFSSLISRIIGEDIELKLNLKAEGKVIMGDPGQIQQVLMNLSTNARDAMPKGGVLKISTEVIQIDENFIKVHGFGTPGKYIIITFSDTGVGMDEYTKSKIFEPFFTTKPIGKGTGLGLSVVYGIIKQHKGYINVYSELGKGTTFRIYLPIIEESVETQQKECSLDLTHLRGEGETILLIEDEFNVRNYIKTVLQEFNYSVIEAANGQEGIEKYLENKDKIKLIILDVIMPVKNGKETIEEIKRINPDIRYVFISGYTSDILSERGLIDEKIEYLTKPISPTNLLQKISSLIKKIE